jgi:hypothetical protein
MDRGSVSLVAAGGCNLGGGQVVSERHSALRYVVRSFLSQSGEEALYVCGTVIWCKSCGHGKTR